MTQLQMWALLVGSFLPPLVAVVQQPGWSRGFRAVVTVVICILVGAVTTYLGAPGGFEFDKDLVGVILTVLVAAQATYQNFWKPTAIAPSVEAATSGRSSG